MDLLDVEVVTHLPEFPLGEESPVKYADMLLTRLFDHKGGVLHAEYSQREGIASLVRWYLSTGNRGQNDLNTETAISPSLGSFRSVLAGFGNHYMGGQLYNGYAMRFLQQRGQVWRCHMYMSNAGQSGFWMRVYAALCESGTSDIKAQAHDLTHSSHERD